MKKFLYLSQRHGIQRNTAGFSLIEVLVALVIISISLLGVAGMQALSFSNTGESGYRSIAATQADSMAATMSVNQMYWQTTTVLPVAQVSSGGVTLGGVTQTPANCTSNGGGQCTPQQMAVYDLALWAAQLNTALPSATGTITCALLNGEQTCTIFVQWYEKNMVQNQQSGTALAATSTPSDLTLMVQP
ncbi:MAG: type IV pilus modification protein PilV [Burkholderiaceae bacterium]|nr:type IV pilus modification protein PilV [Burkholderiaceae bacterium]